jgi:hypothetical protein
MGVGLRDEGGRRVRLEAKHPDAPLPRFFATSPATAPNTSGGDDSRATSVATRRSAACSSASLSTSALA